MAYDIDFDKFIIKRVFVENGEYFEISHEDYPGLVSAALTTGEAFERWYMLYQHGLSRTP